MGLSSSKQKTTSNATTSQTGTTTPQNPEWVTDSISDWVGRIGSMMDADPNAFVAPASPLQQKAWGNTGQLDAWKGQMQSASDLAFRAGNQGANLMGSPSQASAAQRRASTYAAPQLGQAQLAWESGLDINPGYIYDAQRPVIAQNQAANAQSAAASNTSERMGAYHEPYQSQVVDTTLADFDAEAGRARAAQAAQAAKAGAFGGSRFALREAQTEGELARARASTAANLRAQGFNTAAALGAGDADRATNTSQFNAGLGTQTSQFNASQTNARNLAQTGLEFDRQKFNSQAGREAGAFNSSALQRAREFNAAQGNQFALTQAGLNDAAARYGAESANAAGSENMGAQNQFALTNMVALNDAARFNASQQDVGAARALQGAGMLGGLADQYGSGVRQDLGLMAQMGDQQRQIEQAYRLAPLAQLEAGGRLLGGTPFGLFSGQQVQTDGTQRGTSVTKSSPSLFDQLLAAGQLGASLFGGGGGGKSGAGS